MIRPWFSHTKRMVLSLVLKKTSAFPWKMHFIRLVFRLILIQQVRLVDPWLLINIFRLTIIWMTEKCESGVCTDKLKENNPAVPLISMEHLSVFTAIVLVFWTTNSTLISFVSSRDRHLPRLKRELRLDFYSSIGQKHNSRILTMMFRVCWMCE